MSSPMRLLHIDIETTPALVYVWGLHRVEVSVDQIVEPTSVLCFGAKWHGEDKIIFHRALRRDGRQFEAMIKAAHKLLSEADAVCHYNGESFDVPRLNAEFVRLGLLPPPPFHQVDLLKVVQRRFGMVSSKLAFVGPYLGIGEKVKHAGWPLWTGCLRNDMVQWALMEEYNRGDVSLLSELYVRVLPWIDRGHPNLNLFDPKLGEDGEPLTVCPTCGSDKLRSNGLRRLATLTYRRYRCLTCGAWARGRFALKTEARSQVR